MSQIVGSGKADEPEPNEPADLLVLGLFPAALRHAHAEALLEAQRREGADFEFDDSSWKRLASAALVDLVYRLQRGRTLSSRCSPEDYARRFGHIIEVLVDQVRWKLSPDDWLMPEQPSGTPEDAALIERAEQVCDRLLRLNFDYSWPDPGHQLDAGEAGSPRVFDLEYLAALLGQLGTQRFADPRAREALYELAQMAFRYSTRRPAAEIDPDLRRPGQSPTSTLAERAHIENCIRELPAELRLLIRLREYAGTDWEEIARLTGRPSSADVRMMHARAMIELGKLVRRRSEK